MGWQEVKELSRYEYVISNEKGNIELDLLKDGDSFLEKPIPLGNPQRAKWHLTRIFNDAIKMIDELDNGKEKKETYTEALIDTFDRLEKLLKVMWDYEEEHKEDKITFCAIKRVQQFKEDLNDVFNKIQLRRE